MANIYLEENTIAQSKIIRNKEYRLINTSHFFMKYNDTITMYFTITNKDKLLNKYIQEFSFEDKENEPQYNISYICINNESTGKAERFNTVFINWAKDNNIHINSNFLKMGNLTDDKNELAELWQEISVDQHNTEFSFTVYTYLKEIQYNYNCEEDNLTPREPNDNTPVVFVGPNDNINDIIQDVLNKEK